MNQLHIISFAIPYPPDYGGVIDVYYKLKALHEAGVSITLHCFQYGGRDPHAELEKYCKKVFYYPRKKITNPFSGLPYIVATRHHPGLLRNLLQDDTPILFEGLHSSFLLKHPVLRSRKKLLRMHNVEHEYYAKLESSESSLFKKLFFGREAALLKAYEDIIRFADVVLAISPNDQSYLEKKFSPVIYLPAFHSNRCVTSKPGRGTFALYHGNLAVGENDVAARFLLREVFSKCSYPLLIAGNNPSDELRSLALSMPNVTLKENVSIAEIDQLIEDAHVHVLPTFQATGIKLKLLNVLYKGRFVIANNEMVDNTGLEDLCYRANSGEEFSAVLNQLWNREYSPEENIKRQEVLNNLFDVNKNAERLKRML